MFDLSVIIPTIRSIDQIEKVIESVANIRGVSAQIVLINDDTKRSLDRTSFVKFRGDLLVLNNFNHGGACGARNLGILHAEGRYCHFLDDDDYFLENEINLSDYFDSDIVCFNAVISVNKGKYKYLTSHKRRRPLKYGNSLGGLPRFLFKTEFLRRAELVFPISLQKYQDLAFLGRALTNNPKIYFVKCSLVEVNYSRNHKGISTRSLFKIQAYYKALLTFNTKQELNENRDEIIHGFLKNQGWYIMLSRVSITDILKLLAMDAYNKQIALAVQHLIIYNMPVSVLLLKSKKR